jgi:hypothetical protein
MTTLPSIAFSFAVLTIGAWLGYYAGRSDARSMRRYRPGIRYSQMTEGKVQRGNGHDGPRTPKSVIVPKPQFPAPRVIREDFLP